MPEPLVTTSPDPAPKPEAQAASDFVRLVKGGASVSDAAEETGLAETNRLIKKRLRELGLYAKIDRVTGRALADSKLWEVVLQGEDRDAITAVKALYPEAEAPLVEIKLSSDIAKMDVTLPEEASGKEGTR